MEQISVQPNFSLFDQVAYDLERKLSEYRGLKIGIRLFSEKSDVSPRTLYRLLKANNRPTYQTLLKVYRAIHNTQNDTLLLELVPEVIRNEIIKCNPNIHDGTTAFKVDIESEIYYDKCFAEIYFMASASPISLELVQYRYGVSGVETMERMVELRALKQTKNGHYVLGENQANFSGKTLKRVGLSLVERFSKPKNAELGGRNIIAFYSEGVSDEAYDQWLKIDENAFYEKVRLSKQVGAKGTKRAFSFCVTDTMELK